MTKIDQKRTADRRRSTEIRQVIETANSAAFAKPTARLAHDLLAPLLVLLELLELLISLSYGIIDY